jgi:hypothetical protein
MKTRRSAPKPKWLIRAINDSKPIRLPRLAGKALSVWIPTLKEFPICQNLRVAPLDPMSGPSDFSKALVNHTAAAALFIAYYNFCLRHQTLQGATPAMAAGLETMPWTIGDLCNKAMALQLFGKTDLREE